MAKNIVNTTLTLLLLAASFYGVKWSQDVTKNLVPISGDKVTLASSNDLSTGPNRITLKVSTDSPIFRIGEMQGININTVPNADIKIITTNPLNKTEQLASITASADENGNYKLNYAVNDRNLLGIFTTDVIVTSDGLQSNQEIKYLLQSWSGNSSDDSQPNYSYPLIP